jgi:hypothetical protein
MIDDQTDRSGSIYSFGETNLASERLRVVSQIFDPTSETFVSETVRNRPALALDLGCGPGFTIRLLCRVVKPERTVGVVRSKVRDESNRCCLWCVSNRKPGIDVPARMKIFSIATLEPSRSPGLTSRENRDYQRATGPVYLASTVFKSWIPLESVSTI